VAARKRPRSQDGGGRLATTGSGVATARAATLAPVGSTWGLRTSGLHAERRLSFYPFKRFPNHSAERTAWAGLDEARSTASWGLRAVAYGSHQQISWRRGAAAGKVASVIRLWRAPWSTNVERVALALAYKGLAVESVLIDYADRSPVLAVSGQELVPVIEDGGVVVSDSLRILRHLEERHPNPRLFPSNPARRAELEVFLDWFDRVWKVAPNAIETELARREADPLETDVAVDPARRRVAEPSAQMRTHLGLFEALLDGRDHLFGEFSAADCAAFPFLKFAAGRDPADDERFHRILEEHQRPAAAELPRLTAWIERVDARPRTY
jgi:glutathione S-transferase